MSQPENVADPILETFAKMREDLRAFREEMREFREETRAAFDRLDAKFDDLDRRLDELTLAEITLAAPTGYADADADADEKRFLSFMRPRA